MAAVKESFKEQQCKEITWAILCEGTSFPYQGASKVFLPGANEADIPFPPNLLQDIYPLVMFTQHQAPDFSYKMKDNKACSYTTGYNSKTHIRTKSICSG